IELPLARPRHTARPSRGSRRSAVLGAALANTVRELGRREGATPFMTLLAAFAALLGRLSGQDDLVIGTPIARRTRIETEGLLGLFVTPPALRLGPSSRASFRPFLAQVREVALGAYARQDLPFERLVESLQPERDVNASPLFQVMFVLQNAPTDDLRLPGL